MNPEPTPALSKPRKPVWLELGPLLMFFVSYQIFRRYNSDMAMIWAAGILAVSAIIALSLAWIKTRHTSPLLIGSTFLIVSMAVLAAITDDKRIIFMKPTLVNSLLGLAILSGPLFKKNIIKSIMGGAIDFPDDKWNILALRWGLFFLALAAINEVIWRNFSEPFWINFKVFGLLPLTIVFTLLHLPFFQKYGTTKT